MTMPGRNFSSNNYRYGFNGKENDKDISEVGQDFAGRIYDGRLGRWLSVDPLFTKFPSNSPYIFCLNSPLFLIDPDGREVIINKATTSNDGPLIVTSVGNLGNTRMSLSLVFNKKTNQYDLIVNQHIQYAAALGRGFFQTGGHSLEYYNSGITESVQVHEKVHYDRNVKAAQMSITIKDPFDKKNKVSFTGTADKVMTDLYNKLNEVYSKQVQNLNKNYEDALKSINNSSLSDEEKKSQIKLLNTEKNKVLRKIDENKQRDITSLKNMVINEVYKNAAPLQVHEGKDGVNAEAASKMSPKAAEYQNGKKINTGDNTRGNLRN